MGCCSSSPPSDEKDRQSWFDNRKTVHLELDEQKMKMLDEMPHKWTDPAIYSYHVKALWKHYAREPKYKKLDGTGIQMLSSDCVDNFVFRSREMLAKKHGQKNEAKIKKALNKLLKTYMPGNDSVHTKLIIEDWFIAQFNMARSGVVKRDTFCVTFPRIHPRLFATPEDGATITLEREQLIEALSKSAKNKELDAKRFKRKDSLPSDVLGVVSMRKRREKALGDGARIDLKALTSSARMRPRTGKRLFDPNTMTDPTGNWVAGALDDDRPRSGRKYKKKGRRSRRSSVADIQSMKNKAKLFDQLQKQNFEGMSADQIQAALAGRPKTSGASSTSRSSRRRGSVEFDAVSPNGRTKSRSPGKTPPKTPPKTPERVIDLSKFQSPSQS